MRVQLLLLREGLERRRALQLHDGLRVRQDVLGFVGGHDGGGAERTNERNNPLRKLLLRN